MQSTKDELAALAALAANVPAERRRQLESQVPFGTNPRFDAGLVAGLARASEIVAEQQGEEAAKALKEIVAVAAARVLEEQQVYERLRAEYSTPELRAQIEAEVELIRTGQVVGIPIEEVIREMEAIAETAERERRNGESGK